MMPMNNPMMMLINAMRGGANPMAVMQQMAGGNPQIAQGMKMLNGKSPEQIQHMAQNMAKERGVDVNDIIRNLGIGNPSGR